MSLVATLPSRRGDVVGFQAEIGSEGQRFSLVSILRDPWHVGHRVKRLVGIAGSVNNKVVNQSFSRTFAASVN